jgi:hypothetical protein
LPSRPRMQSSSTRNLHWLKRGCSNNSRAGDGSHV